MTEKIYLVRCYMEYSCEVSITEKYYIGLKNAFKFYKEMIMRESCIDAYISLVKPNKVTGELCEDKIIVTR